MDLRAISPPAITSSLEDLAALFEGVFGPRGGAVLVQNSVGGSAHVCRLSSHLVARLAASNPAAGLVLREVGAHVGEFGDGGAVAGLLCCRLVLALQEARVGAAAVQEVLRQTDQALSSLAPSLALSDPPNLSRLLAFSRGFLHKKLHASPKQRAAFAEAAVRAAVEALPSRPVVLRRSEAGPLTAEGVPGLLLPVKRTRGLRAKLRPQMKTVLVTASLSGDVGEIGADRVTAVGRAPPSSMLEGALQNLRGFGARVAASGADLLLCQRVVHPSLRRQLQRCGILVIDRLGEGSAQLLTWALEWSPLPPSEDREIGAEFLRELRTSQELWDLGQGGWALQLEVPALRTLLVRPGMDSDLSEAVPAAEGLLSAIGRLVLGRSRLCAGGGRVERAVADLARGQGRAGTVLEKEFARAAGLLSGRGWEEDDDEEEGVDAPFDELEVKMAAFRCAFRTAALLMATDRFFAPQRRKNGSVT